MPFVLAAGTFGVNHGKASFGPPPPSFKGFVLGFGHKQLLCV
jgi:hypothetical protein